MGKPAFVRVRVDHAVKAEAEAVLRLFGLTLSDAVRMTLARIACEKQVPAGLKVPNAQTQAAMDESRAMMAKRNGRAMTGSALLEALDRTDR